ncbi:MAG: phosphotransferase [Chloroflexi bacterium]|nr:phosphotransferase [Chloroflexota bacterium]
MPSAAGNKLLNLAQMRLSDALEADITLHPNGTLDSQHSMLRCRVEGPGMLPESVILKQFNQQDDDPWAKRRFRNEWAALEFLSGLGLQLAPTLLLGDPATNLMIMEDLGNRPTVQDLLFDPASSIAEEALLELGTCLGRLHAATAGREEAFAALQTRLGALAAESDSSLDLRSRWESIEACFVALGLPLTGDFIQAAAEMEAWLHGAHPLRALVHCDAGVHNFLWMDPNVRLMDFEFASYECALLDVVPARLGFPPSFRSRRVPPRLVARLEANYRTELGKAIPAAWEDDVFQNALVEACAHWSLSRIEGLWRNYLKLVIEEGEERARETVGVHDERLVSYRNKVFTYVSGFVDAAAELERAGALRKPLKALLGEFRKLWPEIALIEVYPALLGE